MKHLSLMSLILALAAFAAAPSYAQSMSDDTQDTADVVIEEDVVTVTPADTSDCSSSQSAADDGDEEVVVEEDEVMAD